jgi:C-terminal processing protease CtpA/Prc
MELSISLHAAPFSDRCFQVEPGDVLESVDGKSITGLGSSEVAQVVRGKPSSRIILGLRRGEDTFMLAMFRDINRSCNRTNIFDNQEWEKAFGYGQKPSGRRTFVVL